MSVQGGKNLARHQKCGAAVFGVGNGYWLRALNGRCDLRLPSHYGAMTKSISTYSGSSSTSNELSNGHCFEPYIVYRVLS